MIFVCGTAMAQRKLTGTVVDTDNKPITGASIVVGGTTVGTTTDAKGAFSVSIPANAGDSITVSYIGYKTEKVNIAGKESVAVTITEAATQMDELVVIGYGQQVARRDLTGSISTVKINDVEASYTSSFDQLLQGRAAGVQVTTGNQAPGGAVNIVIRGASSLNGSSEPLYVVDGIIINPSTADVSSAVFAGGRNSSSQESQNALSAINPQDIASMEVLKDASATAIYGSMGANGVVLITTKTGSTSKPKIELSTTMEMAQVSREIPMLNLQEYTDYMHKTGWGTAPNAGINFSVPDSLGVDWQKYSTRTALSENVRLSISGRTEKDNYMVAVGFANNQGIIKQTGLGQGSLRMNYEHTVNKWVKFGTKTSFAYITNTMTSGTDANASNNSSMIRQMMRTAPYFQKIITDTGDEDDSPVGTDRWFADYDDKSAAFTAIPSLYTIVTINNNLKFNATLGANYNQKTRNRYWGPLIAQSAFSTMAPNTRAGLAEQTAFRYNFDGNLNWTKSYGNHSINAMGGISINNSITKNTVNEGMNMLPYDLRGLSLNNATLTYPEQYDEAPWRLLSFMGRVLYKYKDRYNLTATLRADGSSKFSQENLFAWFPSFAAAWQVDREPWFHVRELSNVKLRVGWGQTGNQSSLTPFQSLKTYAVNQAPAANLVNGNFAYETGVAPSTRYNPDLKWETSGQWNVGLDLGVFKNRINFTADFYRKMTRDLLQSMLLAPQMATGADASPVSNMWVNRGKILNQGLELSIDAIPVSTNSFTWSISANFSLNRNKIVDLGLSTKGRNGMLYGYSFLGGNIGSSSYMNAPANIFIVGQPMGMFFGFKTAGVVNADMAASGKLPTYQGSPQQEGMVNYLDLNGDGDVTDDDRTIIGNPNPKFIAGLSMTFTYKRLSLDFAFNSVYGNQIANGNSLQLDHSNGPNNITKKAYYEAYPNGNMQALLVSGNSNYNSVVATQMQGFPDWIVEDGSFLRLSNVSLSYMWTLPRNRFAQSIRFSVTGRNLWLWTKYSGFDPEVNSFTNDPTRIGVDWASYPNSKGVVFGLNITF